jgi:small GTP-binding protein
MFKVLYSLIIKMQPEKEDGNIEYKLKLVNVTQTRIEELATQMRYRCEEGGSECIYNIGVEDDGTQTGLSKYEFEKTFEALNGAADKNNYVIQILSKTKINNEKDMYEVLIRENNQNKYTDIKILVAGSVDSGKSTILSVLTQGKNDNGRGSARLSVFNFSHEVKSGRTSSIAQHILGYDINGNIVNYKSVGKLSWPDIVKQSSKIISFFDLAGHEKYLKTTILGLTSTSADLCFIIVGANRGILKMTKEHIFLCTTLGTPFVIIVTKIDMVKDKENVLKNTTESINKLVKCPGVRRIPVKVDTEEDIITCAKNVHSESIVPIFHISNVTGEGVDNIRRFLNILPYKNTKNKEDKVEFIIDTTFSVPGVGTVVGGQLNTGNVKMGDTLYIGPNNGKYVSVIIKGIHCKRVPVQKVESGCYVCFALRKIERNSIRKGNVLISQNSDKILCKKFNANVVVWRAHSTTIREGKYEPVVHAHAMKQSARLVSVKNKWNARNTVNNDDNILRAGDRATITMTFCSQPEYLKSGMKILLCEGRTKISGVII